MWFQLLQLFVSFLGCFVGVAYGHVSEPLFRIASDAWNASSSWPWRRRIMFWIYAISLQRKRQVTLYTELQTKLGAGFLCDPR